MCSDATCPRIGCYSTKEQDEKSRRHFMDFMDFMGGGVTMTASEIARGRLRTWAGEILVAASAAGVRSVELPCWTEGTQPQGSRHLRTIHIDEHGAAEADEMLVWACDELADYFTGTRHVFTVPLAAEGTPFYAKVWQTVSDVAYGVTSTYGEIAHTIGAPTAFRAVGAANGANPVAPFVPCHRIVAADGQLRDYGPGLPLKHRLLVMEGAVPASPEDYDAWSGSLRERHGAGVLLGLRPVKVYCHPGCVRSRAGWFRPTRLFASAEDAERAGYRPCPTCGGR